MRENIYGRSSVAGWCDAVGVDTGKYSGCRQRVASKVFAAGADYLIVGGHHGAVVVGANLVERHLDLTVMLDRVGADSVRVVPVEDAARSARPPMARKFGVPTMRRCGAEVIWADGDRRSAARQDAAAGRRLR